MCVCVCVCVGTDSNCLPYLSFIGLVMTVNVNHSAYVCNGIVCVPEYSHGLDASFETQSFQEL